MAASYPSGEFTLIRLKPMTHARETRTRNSCKLTRARNLYVCHTDLQQDISCASLSHQIERVLFRASFWCVCHGLYIHDIKHAVYWNLGLHWKCDKRKWTAILLLKIDATFGFVSFADQLLQGGHFPDHIRFPDFSSRAGKDSLIYSLTRWSTVVASR